MMYELRNRGYKIMKESFEGSEVQSSEVDGSRRVDNSLMG
jgi:hypothetical protein